MEGTVPQHWFYVTLGGLIASLAGLAVTSALLTGDKREGDDLRRALDGEALIRQAHERTIGELYTKNSELSTENYHLKQELERRGSNQTIVRMANRPPSAGFARDHGLRPAAEGITVFPGLDPEGTGRAVRDDEVDDRPLRERGAGADGEDAGRAG